MLAMMLKMFILLSGGGDGTLNVAVNGIMNFNKTYLGLIPAGSGNDFVHSNSISGTYEDIIERITDVSRVLLWVFSPIIRV